jgi:hypothetical protein
VASSNRAPLPGTRDFDKPADPFMEIGKIDMQLRLLVRHLEVKDPRKLGDVWITWGQIDKLLDYRLIVMELDSYTGNDEEKSAG